MHSFIVTTQNFPIDQYHLHIVPETSIGIDNVRNIQSFLSKKPIRGKKNIAILHDAHLLTHPAQQAILKTLEEPPGNSEIYLVTTQPDTLLPTILSRCQLIQTMVVIPSEVEGSLSLIKKLLSAGSVSERIELLDTANFDRKSFSDFLDQFELYLHNSITNSSVIPAQAGIQSNLISQTRTYLKSNCNLRLVLTAFATCLN